jgi:hypothetical protein
MTASSTPPWGLGCGWRPELAWPIDQRRDLGFVEVLAENLPDAVPVPLQVLVERGMKTVVHGVSLSLGGAERPAPERLQRLSRAARQLHAACISEHVAFVRAGEIDSGHLLPVPRTKDSLQVATENVREAQDQLPVPLVLENIAQLFEWPGNEMSEAEFLAELIDATGAGLLLDVSNLYANQRNFGIEPSEFLNIIPTESIVYLHVAGGVDCSGSYRDTHAHDLHDGILQLLREVLHETRPFGVMLERDDRFGSASQWHREMDSIRDCWQSSVVKENNLVAL